MAEWFKLAGNSRMLLISSGTKFDMRMVSYREVKYFRLGSCSTGGKARLVPIIKSKISKKLGDRNGFLSP